MVPPDEEGMDTFFAMVGFFMMTVGFLGAIVLMVVGLALQLIYGEISISGQNLFVVVGLGFGAMAFLGVTMFMAQFFIHRRRFRLNPDDDSE